MRLSADCFLPPTPPLPFRSRAGGRTETLRRGPQSEPPGRSGTLTSSRTHRARAGAVGAAHVRCKSPEEETRYQLGALGTYSPAGGTTASGMLRGRARGLPGAVVFELRQSGRSSVGPHGAAGVAFPRSWRTESEPMWWVPEGHLGKGQIGQMVLNSPWPLVALSWVQS